MLVMQVLLLCRGQKIHRGLPPPSQFGQREGLSAPLRESSSRKGFAKSAEEVDSFALRQSAVDGRDLEQGDTCWWVDGNEPVLPLSSFLKHRTRATQDPLVIGGFGGSGTRAWYNLFRALGVPMMGDDNRDGTGVCSQEPFELQPHRVVCDSDRSPLDVTQAEFNAFIDKDMQEIQREKLEGKRSNMSRAELSGYLSLTNAHFFHSVVVVGSEVYPELNGVYDVQDGMWLQDSQTGELFPSTERPIPFDLSKDGGLIYKHRHADAFLWRNSRAGLYCRAADKESCPDTAASDSSLPLINPHSEESYWVISDGAKHVSRVKLRASHTPVEYFGGDWFPVVNGSEYQHQWGGGVLKYHWYARLKGAIWGGRLEEQEQEQGHSGNDGGWVVQPDLKLYMDPHPLKTTPKLHHSASPMRFCGPTDLGLSDCGCMPVGATAAALNISWAVKAAGCHQSFPALLTSYPGAVLLMVVRDPRDMAMRRWSHSTPDGMEMFDSAKCRHTNRTVASCSFMYEGPGKQQIGNNDPIPQECYQYMLEAWAKYHTLLAGWGAARCREHENFHIVRSEDLLEQEAWPRVMRVLKRVMRELGRPAISSETILHAIKELAAGRLHKRNQQSGSYGRWRSKAEAFKGVSGQVLHALAQFDYPV